MPLYEYQCTKCRKKTEKLESVSGPHLKRCPHCGGKVERVLAAPAIQFKGSGWYVTDYAGRKASREASAAEKGTPTESAKETPAKEAKETPSKETKEKSSKK